MVVLGVIRIKPHYVKMISRDRELFIWLSVFFIIKLFTSIYSLFPFFFVIIIKKRKEEGNVREKVRIQRILSLLETIWQQQFDVRFHQLISNL
ncbi:hypothetical protein CEW92_01130 [Bacillaceae bacterium SAS-127]|nr:hypothetical protein CEW92_01130 [Bacillaceae bacterium SAS-127]